ncbi:DUF2336 domain-containing protein [Roseibium sp.]|uniref:DUF2336 domain-containing protein n=1 Tax=Roseibium sp. TaxID=1936156 RepID=UPI003A96B423
MLRDSLEELARIKEPEARSRLIRALVAEYARSEDHEPTEIEKELFCKIVLSVFEQLDRGARYELVVRLAKTDRITSELADRLAQEDFELSEPVIESSPMVSAKALEYLARHGSDRHKLAVAHRPGLSEEIIDTLIARGQRPVVHTLLANENAPISIRAILALLIFANTEAEVLGGLARRALNDQDFRSTLTMVIDNDCPLAPPPLKRALENDDLERLAKNVSESTGVDEIEIDGHVYSRHEASVQIASGELSFDSMLLTLFEQKRVDAAVWLISRKVNLESDVVLDTFRSDSDAAVMMLMLRTGINDTTYRDFLKARCNWLERSTRNIHDLARRYKLEFQKRNYAQPDAAKMPV